MAGAVRGERVTSYYPEVTALVPRREGLVADGLAHQHRVGGGTWGRPSGHLLKGLCDGGAMSGARIGGDTTTSGLGADFLILTPKDPCASAT